MVAIFTFLSLAFSFRIFRAVDLNLSLIVWACSSSALRVVPRFYRKLCEKLAAGADPSTVLTLLDW